MADIENNVEDTPIEDQEMGEGIEDAVGEEVQPEPDLPTRESFLE